MTGQTQDPGRADGPTKDRGPEAADEHRAVDPAEQAAAAMTAAGMPRMPARVMMALIAAPGGGYTAAEVADRLGVSAAAVSGALSYLQRTHLVERRSRPGDRRDRYDIVAEVFYASVTTNAGLYLRLADLIERIGDAHPDDAVAHDRADGMVSFFRFIAERLPQLVEEWRAGREIPPDFGG